MRDSTDEPIDAQTVINVNIHAQSGSCVMCGVAPYHVGAEPVPDIIFEEPTRSLEFQEVR
jgi:hypothetical protein